MLIIRSHRLIVITCSACVLLCLRSEASGLVQSVPDPCVASSGSHRRERENIFDDQQEVWLSEAMREDVAPSFISISDGSQDQRLQRITDRLSSAHFQTGVRFQAQVISAKEANAFSVPDGQIYLTQTMVRVIRNDDELAFVIAHEMGHVICHDLAIEVTRELRAALRVTALGGRSSIFAAYRRLLNGQHGMDSDYPDQERDQREADQVAVALMKQAGYRPEAGFALWRRMSERGWPERKASEQDSLRLCELQALTAKHTAMGTSLYCPAERSVTRTLEAILRRLLLPLD